MLSIRNLLYSIGSVAFVLVKHTFGMRLLPTCSVHDPSSHVSILPNQNVKMAGRDELVRRESVLGKIKPSDLLCLNNYWQARLTLFEIFSQFPLFHVCSLITCRYALTYTKQWLTLRRLLRSLQIAIGSRCGCCYAPTQARIYSLHYCCYALAYPSITIACYFRWNHKFAYILSNRITGVFHM